VLLLVLPLASCLDAIGVGSACEERMQEVRRVHGAPDRTEHGVRAALWFYGPPRSFYYEFSWSGETCTVRGPFSESRIPAWPHHLMPYEPLPTHAGETR
jgi:hypothetical protein